jgi:hypothetical protein
MVERDEATMRLLRSAVRRVNLAAALVAATACWLAIVSGGEAASRRTSSAHSATQLLSEAFADAKAKGSFHQSLTQVSGGVHGSLEDDVALTSGRQLIVSSNGTRAEVEVVGQTAYVSGNQYALKSYFKFTSNQVAVIGSNWVSVPSTSTIFASISYDVTVPTALEEVAPSGHLTEGPQRTIAGQRVIPISGGVPAGFTGGTASRTTLYVTAGSDPLPVRASVEVGQTKQTKLSLMATMSDWGEHVAVTAPSGQALSASQISVLTRQLSGLSIPGEPGYFAVDGQHGHVAFGRPWGEACTPIRFAVNRTVPDWVYAQITTVIAQARAQGIDVAIESRGLQWKHGALYYRSGQSPAASVQVNIAATTAKAQLPMELSWKTKLDGDKHSADLTSVGASFSLKALDGRSATVRRSIRQLIAWTQGIFETTDPISGITLRSFTDSFTPSDVSAMLAMSGCAKPAGGTTTGTTTGPTPGTTTGPTPGTTTGTTTTIGIAA